MANEDVEDALDALTKEEIGELVELIDPDNSCLHPSERMPPQTTKQPTGPFNRDNLLSYLKQQAESSKIGEDYIPYKKEVRGKVYKPKQPVEPVKKETKKSKFAEELDQMLSLVEQDDLADLASELGLDEISTHMSNSNAKANSGAGLVDTSVYSYKRSESPKVYPKPDKQDTDIEESIARLLELDPLLSTLNLNNHPELDESLFQKLCDALIPNTYLISLQLAGTGLGDNQAKMLVPVLKHNLALQSLNLDSNCFTGSAIKILLTALQDNKNLKELKLSNQKHPVGAGIEMQMAKLIASNTTLLKFGYSFTSAGPRVLVEKYMIRNNEISRQEKML